MTSTLAQTTNHARPLRELVPMIKRELELGQAAGLEHYRKAGELLLEAREQLAPGEWSGWIKDHFRLSHTTALRWMALAGTTNRRARKLTTLSEAYEPHRDPGHRVLWHEPVKLAIDKVNIERMNQERQNREREERLTRELALRLIDIGYRALAEKLHPDKGGSLEAMVRLNHVRHLLKQAI